jgi:AcrR family transcriptional regulator
MTTTGTDGGTHRSRDAVATRKALVDAAIAQFAEEGFARASIDRIAKAADLTKGAVYHHFADKEQLFEGAFTALEDRFLEKLGSGTDGIDAPRPRLVATIDLFLAQCRQPDYLRIAVVEAPAALGWERWKELGERYFAGRVSTALDSLYGSDGTDPAAAGLLVAAASAAGLELSTVAAHRAPAERQRLGALLMRMADALGA